MASRDRNKRKEAACASCRYQRKRCPEDCILAPYFPSDLPDDFVSNVYRVFPRANIVKWLKDAPLDQREGLMNAIKTEAIARASDPVLGISRFAWQLQRLIYDAKRELYHKRQELALHRRRAMSTNVLHGQGAAPSNLQDFMNVPPNPYGQGGHPSGFYDHFPASWTSTSHPNQNDAGFSWLGLNFENQPNPPFSLPESIHDHRIAPSTSLSLTSLNPFLASSSQPIQNQPIVQTFPLTDSAHHGNISERIAPSMNQSLNLFLDPSSQPIQNQPIVQLYSLPDSVHYANAIAPTSMNQTFSRFDIASSSSQPIQNQPTIQLSSLSGSNQDHEDEYLSFWDLSDK